VNLEPLPLIASRVPLTELEARLHPALSYVGFEHRRISSVLSNMAGPGPGDFLDWMNPPSLRSYGGQAEFTGIPFNDSTSDSTELAFPKAFAPASTAVVLAPTT
jgi:hypothetical protein